MRILTLSTAVALALACRASAAVAAVPTGEGSSVVVERPDVAERDAALGTAPQLPWPCGVFSSMFAGVTSSAHTPSAATPTTVDANPGATDDGFMMRGTEDADIVTTLESPSSAPPQPYATTGCIIDSYADLIACAKAGLLNAFCPSGVSGVSLTRRDQVEGHAGPRRTSWVTEYSTSTIASTTTTIYMTSSSSSPTFTGFAPPKIGIVTELGTSVITDWTLTATTDPTRGVSVVETTVLQTVTFHPYGIKASTTHTTGVQMTEPCSNSTSTDTQTYLNISTFSMTGFTSLPAPTSTSMSPFFTHSSSFMTTDTTRLTTARNTAGAASTNSVQGSTTVTLGSAASGSTIDLSGFQLPTTMVVAIAACFVLALFL